jgi:hypothetical protein
MRSLLRTRQCSLRRYPALTRLLYFGIYSLVAMTYFPSDGKIGRPLSPAMCRHAPTSGQVKCGECPHQAFIAVTDDIIEKHLRGGNGARASNADFVAGVYPLLPDETCWFLAADFDEENWAADALAMLETCRAKGVPAALERSRLAMAVMSGFSSPSRFLRAQPGHLEPQC